MTELDQILPGEQNFPYFFVQCDGKGKLVKVHKEDILYVESILNYLHIHLEGKTYVTYLTITEMEEILSPVQFMRIHKSFVVNLEKIIGVEGNMIYLDKKVSIVLGPNYRKLFFDRLAPMLVRSKRRSH
jgi:DNA-binding LytR/AlgR family response regulator